MNHDADGIGDMADDRPLSPGIKAAIDSVEPAAGGDSFWSNLDRKLDLVDSERRPVADGSRAEFGQPADSKPPVDPEPSILQDNVTQIDRRGRARFLAAAALVLFAAGLAWVLLQGQGVSTDPAEGGLPEPSVLIAEDMAVKVEGEPVPGGWLIWRPGFIEDEVVFPSDGIYEFAVVASGRFDAGGEFGPDLAVLLDSITVGVSLPVKLDAFEEYRFVRRVEAGTHTVGVSNTLLSVPTRPMNDEGTSPVLLIDRITISLVSD